MLPMLVVAHLPLPYQDSSFYFHSKDNRYNWAACAVPCAQFMYH
jgi:hypothetical protein